MRLAPIVSGLVLVLAGAASAVIIDSGDGTGNTSAPTAPDCLLMDCSDPGFAHVGIRTTNGLTGVYLGGRYVLTAAHVGAGEIAFGGVPYTYVPGTAVQLDNGDSTSADLLMFQVYPEPPLPALAIASVSPIAGTPMILAGNGLNRGPATSWNLIGGYEWGPGQSRRWGTNSAAGVVTVEIGGLYTTSIQTTFDQNGSDHEAQGAVGDSGGAAFAQSVGQWQLAGIVFAIGSAYPGQPPNTALYGNLTFSADLATYRDQILDVIALPEPALGLAPGVVWVAALARRRQRRSSATTRS